MVFSLFSCSKPFIPVPSASSALRHIPSPHPFLPITTSSGHIQHKNCSKDLALPSVASVPYQPISVDYLEEEFNGHGITFQDIGGGCMAKMKLENGSTANLLLPSGVITSYKAHMWHGGTTELLHTSVSEGDVGAQILGGVSITFNFESESRGDTWTWSPSIWELRDVRGNSAESIEVELINREANDSVELKYIVTLRKDALSSEVQVSNLKPTSLKLTGCILSHLTVSTPDATYAVGLEGSDFYSTTPFMSDYFLNPPKTTENNGLSTFWNQLTPSMFPGWGSESNNSNENDEDIQGEEDDNDKHLRDQMSLLYKNAPRGFTVIDRGRRNSVMVHRDGFEELYLFSPGSSHESYGRYTYVCVGQAATLEPIVIGPGELWEGGQHLYNPNL